MLSTEERKNKLKRFFLYLKQNQEEKAFEELNEILEDIIKEHNRFIDRGELKEILLKMKQGFELTHKLILEFKEYSDKRFEDLIHNSNQRFEEVNKRITILQWGLGVFLSLFFGFSSLFNFFEIQTLKEIIIKLDNLDQRMEFQKK